MSPGEMLPGPMSQGLTCQAQLNFCQVKFWLGLGFDCMLWTYISFYIWSRAVPIKKLQYHTIIHQKVKKATYRYFIFLNFCSTCSIVPVLTTSRKVDFLECLFVLGKFQDAYWLTCEPMRNKAKVAGNLVQLHCTV